ncbi:MAG TPA: sigma-70 family RNA polymerase sigma factor [Ohtaekwangia sp.]
MLSDKEILAAIHLGDDRVLKHLYETVLPKVKNYVTRNSGSPDDARDIFQDAVVVFYKYVKQGKFDGRHDIAGFIFSISRNLWINMAKRNNRSLQLSEEVTAISSEDNFSDELITREREEYITKLFSALGNTCRQILLYSIYDKLSMKEIKEKMNFSSENVAKTKNYKCKQRLMELVKNNTAVREFLKT